MYITESSLKQVFFGIEGNQKKLVQPLSEVLYFTFYHMGNVTFGWLNFSLPHVTVFNCLIDNCT